jgi:hypothetical protein
MVGTTSDQFPARWNEGSLQDIAGLPMMESIARDHVEWIRKRPEQDDGYDDKNTQ